VAIVIKKNKKKLNLLIVIPARLGSTRLKHKLLKKIDGTSMIIRVAQNAIKMKLGQVLVATDSKKILDLCYMNDIQTVMTSRKHKSGTDRICEAYDLIDEEFDLVVNLQGDLPYFKKELISKTVELFRDQKTDIGSAVCDLDENEVDDLNVVKANVVFNKNDQGFAIDFRRKVKTKKNFYHHIGIYVYKPSVLKRFVFFAQSKNEVDRSLEQMRAMDNGMKIKLVKLSYNPPSVDSLSDLEKIRLHFKQNHL
jgi:3-deoxy-manno-octulosonate cytidylyltransferase (CMP-KDO synthetase)